MYYNEGTLYIVDKYFNYLYIHEKLIFSYQQNLNKFEKTVIRNKLNSQITKYNKIIIWFKFITHYWLQLRQSPLVIVARMLNFSYKAKHRNQTRNRLPFDQLLGLVFWINNWQKWVHNRIFHIRSKFNFRGFIYGDKMRKKVDILLKFLNNLR